MKITKVVFLLLACTIVVLGCNNSKEEANQDSASTRFKYSVEDAKSRLLKRAIEAYQAEDYKTASDNIDEAKKGRLKDNDEAIIDSLQEKIEEHLNNHLTNLDSLAVKGKLYAYNFEYQQLLKKYRISERNPRLKQSKETYLARVKKSNDKHLSEYFELINDSKNNFNYSEREGVGELSSIDAPIKVITRLNGYKGPELIVQLVPSQLESTLETIEVGSSSHKFFFNKHSQRVQNYNVTIDKVVEFKYSDSDFDIPKFVQMLDDDDLFLSIKWFYEPETKSISAKAIKSMKAVIDLHGQLISKFNERKQHLYIPSI